jgi:hypothetical protein
VVLRLAALGRAALAAGLTLALALAVDLLA